MKKAGLTYRILLHGESMAPSYKAQMLPTIYVLDQQGRVLHAERGFRENAEEDLTGVIDKALKH